MPHKGFMMHQLILGRGRFLSPIRYVCQLLLVRAHVCCLLAILSATLVTCYSCGCERNQKIQTKKQEIRSLEGFNKAALLFHINFVRIIWFRAINDLFIPSGLLGC